MPGGKSKLRIIVRPDRDPRDCPRMPVPSVGSLLDASKKLSSRSRIVCPAARASLRQTASGKPRASSPKHHRGVRSQPVPGSRDVSAEDTRRELRKQGGRDTTSYRFRNVFAISNIPLAPTSSLLWNGRKQRASLPGRKTARQVCFVPLTIVTCARHHDPVSKPLLVGEGDAVGRHWGKCSQK